MANQLKAGKRPLSQKTQAPAIISSDDIFINPLSLDAGIKKVIEAHGFRARFINFKQFVELGGTHQAYWTPVPRAKLKEWGYDKLDSQGFTMGNDADGYVRRGDLVLAIRSVTINDKHKAYLKQEASRASMTQKRTADEARALVGNDSGIRVHEGYQDDYQPENDKESESD